MIKTLIAAFGAALLIGAGAGAEDAAPLTTDEAQRFVETLGPAQALGDALKDEGKAEALAVEMQPKADQAFKPYSNAVGALKEKYPAEHARLDAIVSAHGFSTESWASVGDRVMIAYLAEKMEQENPGALEQMKAMDPSMLAMMPENMQAQMGGVMALIKAVESAPAGDREAIGPVMADLDAFMESQE